jgi:RNA polymerase sigma-70 factor (ECF subfamily)
VSVRPTAADLFARHHLALFRFVYRATGRPDVAEDVVQDVFVRVVRGLETYRADGRDAAWLFAIARRLLLDRHRAAVRRPEAAEADPNAHAVDPGQERSLAIDEALAQLPDDDRDVFLMREVGGLGYDDIAAASGLTPDAVRSRIYRARMRLRLLLSDSRKVLS